MYIRAKDLAYNLTLNKGFSVAPLHVRFLEDETSVRVFLSPTGISFSPSITIHQLLQSFKHAANPHFPVDKGLRHMQAFGCSHSN